VSTPPAKQNPKNVLVFNEEVQRAQARVELQILNEALDRLQDWPQLLPLSTIESVWPHLTPSATIKDVTLQRVTAAIATLRRLQQTQRRLRSRRPRG
jgi:hypothetical protein